MNPTTFFNTYKQAAVDSSADTGLLPSITLAQMALESGWGESELASKYNNFFGMKGTGTAGSVTMRTREEDKYGNSYYINAKFRAYNNAIESLNDHANNFFRLKNLYARFLNAKDYKTAAYGLQGVYATDTRYASKLISIIEQNNLQELDKYVGKGGGKLPDVGTPNTPSPTPTPNPSTGGGGSAPSNGGTDSGMFSGIAAEIEAFNEKIQAIIDGVKIWFTETLPTALKNTGWIALGIVAAVIGVYFLMGETEGVTA